MARFVLPERNGREPANGFDPAESARAARLRYVIDAAPGIRRRRAGKGFYYLLPDGSTVRDSETLERIRSLAVPPAWREVWICLDPRGHLQATGYDSRGRKQYRYHNRWREARDAVKYDRMIAFGEALPAIRQRVEGDLALPGLPREKVLAAVVRLLDGTLARVGNEEYRRENGSFGLTTLRDRHVQVAGSRVSLRFRGKGGRQLDVRVTDRRLARVVRQSQEIPGQQLFQYLDDDGGRHTVESENVNEYLREVSGGDFTAKDFRTWGGSVAAHSLLCICECPESERDRKRLVVDAVEQVACLLGNTPAICRKSYIHPGVLEAYLIGALSIAAAGGGNVAGRDGLSAEEHAFLSFLRARQAVSGPSPRPARAA